MPKYAILWKSIPNTTVSGAQLIGGAEPDAQPARITIKDMDEQEAQDALKTPEVGAISIGMEALLIKPMSSGTPSDVDSWGIEAVGAATTSYTGAGVKVAILDTGIERSHPAFAGMVFQEKDFTGTGNGDGNGHGTHCAGTVFGRDVAGKRIGVARGVDNALIGKVLDANGKGSSLSIFHGLQWAIQQGAHIISLSLGFNFPGEVKKKVSQGWPIDLATSEALVAFRENLGMFNSIMEEAKNGSSFRGGVRPLIIAAAGNESRREENPNFRISKSLPAAACDIAVGAVKKTGAKMTVADFSNVNPHLGAPGVDIVSAALGGGLIALSGTSMACPHVAGIAALWAEKIKSDGEPIKCSSVYSHLLSTTERNIITNWSDIDLGRGLVKAP